MKIEINTLDDLSVKSDAFWHPISVSMVIVLTTVGFTFGVLKLAGVF